MTTAAPCDDLSQVDAILVREAAEVKEFLARHRRNILCPITLSVDIRRNADKAAVVDANAFPAGFNNLAQRSHAQASQALKGYLGAVYPKARHLVLLAENHTRNTHYFEHLRVLAELLGVSGHVTVASLNPDVRDGALQVTSTGASVRIHRARRDGTTIVADGRAADLVVLNNDLSDGVPDELKGLDVPVTPPPSLGWHRRRKSEHFELTNDLCAQLGRRFGFDPWLISAEFEAVHGIDFKAQEGLDAVADAIDAVLERTRAKYAEHKVRRDPAVFVKADSGTYGMAITTATSGKAFLAAMNSRARQEMDRGKSRVKTTSLLVQESIPTDVRTGRGWVAEPVLYMVCGHAVGGFHRAHEAKSDQENLNSPGSRFHPFAFLTQEGGRPGPDEMVLDPCSAHVYAALGEVSSIATGYEAKFGGPATTPQYA